MTQLFRHNYAICLLREDNNWFEFIKTLKISDFYCLITFVFEYRTKIFLIQDQSASLAEIFPYVIAQIFAAAVWADSNFIFMLNAIQALTPNIRHASK